MRKFAAFDIDGTLIRWQLYHAISDQLVKDGYIDGQRFESIRGARRDWKRRAPGASFRSYELQVIAAYEEALLKLNLSQLDQAVEKVFEEYKDQVYIYTRNLIRRLKGEGYLLFAISGSQLEIVEKVAQYYDFDAFVGTEYAYQNDKFTGQKIFHAGKKDLVLKKLAEQAGADWEDSVAIGDSKSDIKMLDIVQTPIAFNPERELFEYAKQKQWKIVIERKNVVIELEPQDAAYILA